jgi:hypothetical protein
MRGFFLGGEVWLLAISGPLDTNFGQSTFGIDRARNRENRLFQVVGLVMEEREPEELTCGRRAPDAGAVQGRDQPEQLPLPHARGSGRGARLGGDAGRPTPRSRRSAFYDSNSRSTSILGWYALPRYFDDLGVLSKHSTSVQHLVYLLA